MKSLEAEKVKVQELLETYRERQHLLETRDPALAIVAQADIGLYDQYRDHFKRKIFTLEGELEILDAKIGVEYYRAAWRALEYEEGSILPDQIADLGDRIYEMEERDARDSDVCLRGNHRRVGICSSERDPVFKTDIEGTVQWPVGQDQ